MDETRKRLPDFLVVGAAKSGTSSLYRYLTRHPQLYMPDLKEPEFFSDPKVNARGLHWYCALFAKAHDGQLVGEASTTYSRWPHTLDAPKLISDAIGNVKLIYIMRHPIDRAYSHYGHHMRTGVTMTFEQAIEKDAIYLDCSNYMMQIRRYLRYFEKEQFLFLFQEDLKTDPAMILEKVQAFLGVSYHDLLLKGKVKANVGGVDHYIRAKTTVRLRQIPAFDWLARVTPKKWRDALYQQLIRNTLVGHRLEDENRLEPMMTSTRERLVKYFRMPNQELETFLGKKLNHWNT